MKAGENVMNFKKYIISLFFLPFCCSFSFADTGGGTVGVQFLNNDFSPRALGMGGAFVAVADDAYGPDYNPAGLGQIKYPEASAMYLSGFDDASLGGLHFGMLLPNVGFAKYARPAFGISLISSSAGDITYRPLDANEYPGQERTLKAQQDYALTLTFAEKFFVGDIILEKLRFEDIEQFYGVNVKYVRSTLVEDYTANGVAGDFGYLLKHNPSGISFGVSFNNLGSGMKYIDETTKMPSVARAGLSWLLPSLYEHQLRLAGEADFHLNEDSLVYRLGAEYTFDRYVALRIGYIGHEDNPAFTLGMSLKYDDMSIDVAGTMGGEVYDTTMASFNYRFSGLAYKGPAVKKRKFRGISEKVAAPVGTKAKDPYKRKSEERLEEESQYRQRTADPVMVPAKKEKSRGSSEMFLLY